MTSRMRGRLRAAWAGPLLALAAGACGSGTRAAPAPPPPAPVPPPVVAAVDPWREIRVCVVNAEGVHQVPARFNAVTGDTLVDGRPFAEAFPANGWYAQSAGWYVNNEPFPFQRIPYVKYALPRIVDAEKLVLRGEHHGIPFFTDRDDPGDPYNMLYVPVRPGCLFQLYQWGGYPPEGFAEGFSWFVDGDPIPWRGRRLVKYGPERTLSPADLERAGEHRGISVYREAGGVSGMIFVPVRPGGVFQPYQVDYVVGGVRGG